MREALLRQRERMNRFNAWEAEHLEVLTLDQRCARFLELFELQRFISEEKLELHHPLHLDSLIAAQKRLMQAQAGGCDPSCQKQEKSDHTRQAGCDG